jgi:hypothetical protein
MDELRDGELFMRRYFEKQVGDSVRLSEKAANEDLGEADQPRKICLAVRYARMRPPPRGFVQTGFRPAMCFVKSRCNEGQGIAATKLESREVSLPHLALQLQVEQRFEQRSSGQSSRAQ